MSEAAVLYQQHSAARKAFETIDQALLFDNFDESGRGRLSLYYTKHRNISQLIEKLSAVERSYQNLGALIGRLGKAGQLEVVKFEANTFWLVVEGDSEIIDVFTLLVEQFIQFIYGRFNGQSRAPIDISERVIATQLLVSLTDVLERKGYREAVADTQRLQKGAKAMRRELALLIAGDPEIEVNNTLYRVDDRGWREYESFSRSLLPNSRVVHQISDRVGA